MKSLSIAFLCFFGLTTYAQNGFFLQPEIGAGMSNICQSQFTFHTANGFEPKNIFSYQLQIEVGYKKDRWEFITGLGYMRTGYKAEGLGLWVDDKGFIQQALQEFRLNRIGKVYNPHIILPVKVGYRLYQLNNKLSFTPCIGAEVDYNLRRTFINDNSKTKETAAEFNANCYRFGVFGVVQLNFEYKASNRIVFTGGPSIHYNLLPLVYFDKEYDYAFLINLGMRYNFKHKAKEGVTL